MKRILAFAGLLLLSGQAAADDGRYGAGGASVATPGVSSSIAGPGATETGRQLPYGEAARPDAAAQQKIDARIDDALEFSRALRDRAEREEADLTPRKAE